MWSRGAMGAALPALLIPAVIAAGALWIRATGATSRRSCHSIGHIRVASARVVRHVARGRNRDRLENPMKSPAAIATPSRSTRRPLAMYRRCRTPCPAAGRCGHRARRLCTIVRRVSNYPCGKAVTSCLIARLGVITTRTDEEIVARFAAPDLFCRLPQIGVRDLSWQQE